MIEIDNLVKRFGPFTAVDGISFKEAHYGSPLRKPVDLCSPYRFDSLLRALWFGFLLMNINPVEIQFAHAVERFH